MTDFKRKLFANLKNIGWPVTNRKLIVFESDDWGSNRMPSIEVYNQLVKEGVLSPNPSHYDKYDTIARAKDLEFLFDTLCTVRDRNGSPAVISPFVNPSNPDFGKIRQSNFQNYYPERFDVTLDRLGEKENVMNLWKQGISGNIFIPAFHGREHLNVPSWIQHLQKRNEKVVKSFNLNFYSVPLNSLPEFLDAFRPALYFSKEEQIPQLVSSVYEGVNQMKELFGQSPKVFCPPNGISHPVFDKESANSGIELVMTNRLRSEPDGHGQLSKSFYSYNSKNKWNQRFYYRNCMFEPTYSRNAINICLMQIEASFRCFKPAIISTHRVNYIGSLEPKNREIGLNELQKLLKHIVKRWPDSEFISSNDLINIFQKASKT